MALYHVTLKKNLFAIFRDGIIPQVGQRSYLAEDDDPRVYAFPDQSSCQNALDEWLGEAFSEEIPEDVVILEIGDLPFRPIYVDQYEAVFDKTIPPQSILCIRQRDFALLRNTIRTVNIDFSHS